MRTTRRMLLLGGAATAAWPLPAWAAGAAMTETVRMSVRRSETFTSGGKTISVEVFAHADAEGPRPAVIMLHGADGLQSNMQYRTGAQAIAGAGYNVFLVHYLDRTAERRASFATMFQNFMPWMETVRDAVAWVSTRPDVEPNRIGLVGISLGAALSLAIAGNDRRIKALVDYFGPIPEGAVARDARLPPTLILHGAADRIVPVDNAYAVESLLKSQGTPHEMKIYPSQGHGFTGEAQTDATRRVLSFLQRHLGGRRGAFLDTLPVSA